MPDASTTLPRLWVQKIIVPPPLSKACSDGEWNQNWRHRFGCVQIALEWCWSGFDYSCKGTCPCCSIRKLINLLSQSQMTKAAEGDAVVAIAPVFVGNTSSLYPERKVGSPHWPASSDSPRQYLQSLFRHQGSGIAHAYAGPLEILHDVAGLVRSALNFALSLDIEDNGSSGEPCQIIAVVSPLKFIKHASYC